MASEGTSDTPRAEPEAAGATEPITLTDPDGSVTRVAPWSSWTREQVRAPGGEPALVTRLEQGQLWFAAGRRRSPWRHEVLVGPATVSTPRGRFHVTAEPDGGATIACLAGRTRVVSGLREPVVLGPDQTAAVASDGATLVVMDRTSGEPVSSFGDEGDDASAPPMVATPPVDETPGDLAAPDEDPVIPLPAVAGGGGDGAEPPDHDDAADDPDRRRLPWLPEIVAVAALLAVLVAAVLVFGNGSSDAPEVADGPRSSTTADLPSTTEEDDTPATTAAPSSSTTAAPTPTTVPPPTTSTTPPAVAPPPTAEGSLASGGCVRAEGGVLATINVSHRSGGPGRFDVSVGLADDRGVYAQATAESAVIDQGATVPVQVKIEAAGELRGGCELLGVAAA